MTQPIYFNLTIGAIKISMVENASAVNIGKNLLIGWDSHTKTNQGLGNISGDSNPLQQMTNQVDDPDKLDFNAGNDSTLLKDNLENIIQDFFKEEE